MRSRISLALLALVGLATLSSAFAPAPVYREPPKPKLPDVYALMQGTWEIQQNVNVLGGMNGGMQAARIRAIRRMQQKIRIQGTTWAYIFDNNGTEIESTKYQIVLDPKASPATLDLKQPDQNIALGGVGGMVQIGEQIAMKGIIKVEGDTLTFCHVYGHQANAERPKQFIAGNQVMPNGTQVVTMTLKRVK